MKHPEIISDLKSRGEYDIKFHEDGRITSMHGKHTLNTWIEINGKLECIDCRTIYLINTY